LQLLKQIFIEKMALSSLLHTAMYNSYQIQFYILSLEVLAHVYYKPV